MSLLRAALRLFFVSAVLLLAGVAVSVMTRDAWLIVAHAAGVLSALVAAVAVLLVMAAALRRLAPPPRDLRASGDDVEPHEQGLTGLDEARSGPSV